MKLGVEIIGVQIKGDTKTPDFSDIDKASTATKKSKQELRKRLRRKDQF